MKPADRKAMLEKHAHKIERVFVVGVGRATVLDRAKNFVLVQYENAAALGRPVLAWINTQEEKIQCISM